MQTHKITQRNSPGSTIRYLSFGENRRLFTLLLLIVDINRSNVNNIAFSLSQDIQFIAPGRCSNDFVENEEKVLTASEITRQPRC